MVVTKMSVTHKLTAIILLLLSVSIAMKAFDLWEYRADLLQERKLQSNHAVSMAYSIIDHFQQQQTAGVLNQTAAQTQALSALQAMRYDNDNYVWINDLDARMIMHPIKPELDGKDMSSFKDGQGKSLFTNIANTARQNNEGYEDYLWPRPGKSIAVEKISYFKLFEPWGWVIGTGVYVDDLDASFYSRLTEALVFLAVVIPFVVWLSSIISRSITQPLSHMTKVMENVAKGKLMARIDIKNQDELGDVSKAINHTLDIQQQLIQKLTNSSHHILSSAEQMASTTEQTSAGVKQQHGETQLLATAMQEMSATAQDVANNAQQTAEITVQAESTARLGDEIVRTTISAINDLAAQVQSQADVITKLEQDTLQVESILSVIRDISDQTNLLALNAAIEAARAGEQGRGFAVVADEVRVLAKRTSESTDQIQSLNDRLKNACQGAVSMMSNSHSEAQNCIDRAASAGEHLNDIVLNVQQIMEMNSAVAEVVQQQSQVAEEMSNNLNNISMIAEQTQGGATLTANNSEQLASLARELRQQVQHFQV
ncbi:methyl-accepting chemotaxis protein [Neptuniibacter sp. QD72_48]|uniref:methyl-accepting chemotaxis protein n=1 Tax=unclassified Neptuniibacter TaxID=2630693 RepID=UPI0039F61A17